MPAKSTSPEAEQKKLWKLEIKDLTRRRKVVQRDFSREFRRLQKEFDLAVRAAEVARSKFRKNSLRLGKAEDRETAKITRRLGFLTGRTPA